MKFLDVWMSRGRSQEKVDKVVPGVCQKGQARSDSTRDRPAGGLPEWAQRIYKARE